MAAFSYDDRVLLERHVEGRELAVGLLETRRRACEALPIVEAKPKEEYFFDFEARYEIGKTDYVCPADLPADVTAAAQELAVATYGLLGCYGFARVDMILAEDGHAAGARGAGDPGPHRDEPLPAGRRGGGDQRSTSWSERLVELALARVERPAARQPRPLLTASVTPS